MRAPRPPAIDRPRRALGRALAGAALALGLALSGPARAGDPTLEWRSLTTPHFRVTFAVGFEAEAQRVGRLAEGIHRRLVSDVGAAPESRVELVLTDDTDSANGSATAVPYDLVRMYLTAPDDMSVLGDYDDWLLALLTHEYTHVVHLDTKSGLPALVNAILGKTYAPNQVQPRWIIEGLAVAMESQHTSGGRVRSTQVDMILRADVLEGRLARLDEISNSPRRWPQGNLWYLYGGNFIGWIASVYGPETFAAVAHDYGANIIPWGVNRSIQRATGRTYPELYQGWQAHLEREVGAQMAEVERRGRREGTRLTARGRVAAAPRFVPRCARAGGGEELVYYKDDGDEPGGLYRLPLQQGAAGAAPGAPATPASADVDARELWARTEGRTATFDADCALVFDAIRPSRRRYYFSELVRLPAGLTSPQGTERTRQALTHGRRARDPDVSPDGRAIAYVTNRSGTTTLRVATLTRDGRLEDERTLVPSGRWEQAYTPRFSPDGRRVAFSAWRRGGYRDVYVVEVASGRLARLTHDRAIDQQPAWSPDGRTLYFVSDRTGIANVYAHRLDDGALRQVTNVRTGAYYPAPSPDGRTLVYVGYGSAGFDLFALPLDEARFLPALPPPDDRPTPPPELPLGPWPVEDYRPWRTLRPHAYDVELTTGPYGDQLLLTTSGSDLVGKHAFSAQAGVDFEAAEPRGALAYSYRGLPSTLRLRLSRSARPRRSYRYGDQTPTYTEVFTGFTSGVTYGELGEYDGQELAFTTTAGSYDAALPVSTLGDPWARVTVRPHRGTLVFTHLGWSYSNVSGTADGVGGERGFGGALGLDWGDPALGGEHTLAIVTARGVGYLPLPWATHHTLAVGASAGIAAGSYPRRGQFFTGGFDPTLPVLDAFTDGVQQSGFVLRGYEPGQFVGDTYNLVNLEYRFPLWYVDRGLSTLPVFLRTLSLAAFLDWGGAYDTLSDQDPMSAFHTGVGGELWIEPILGYFAGANLRLGLAQGLDSDAAGLQGYLVVAAPL